MLKKVKENFVKLNKILNSNIFKYIIFFVYLSLTFILVLNHEIWIDEAQAWEIARTLSIPEIFAQMKYEGHSCMWHLILAIPAKMGLPVISMNIISFIFVSIAVYMILFKAKWNIFVKVAVIFNPTFLYYLLVISRCYSLIPLLVCLFVIYYPNRHKHPIIYTNILGLLAHTHVIMCSFVGVAALFFVIECIRNIKKEYKKLIIVLLIFLIYFILLAAQILPALDNCGMYGDFYDGNRLEVICNLISAYFLPKIIANISPYIILFVFLVIFILLFLYNKKFSFTFVTMVVCYIVIHFHWPHVLYERTCIIFVLMVILNFFNKGIFFQVFITIVAILCSISSFYYIPGDLMGALSVSEDTGKWINENVEDYSLIIFLNTEHQVSIVPYVDLELDYYYMKSDLYQTFVTWTNNVPYLSISDVYIKLKEFNMQYDNIYVVHSLHRDVYAEDTIKIVDLLYQGGFISLEYEGFSNALLEEHFLVYKLVRI